MLSFEGTEMYHLCLSCVFKLKDNLGGGEGRGQPSTLLSSPAAKDGSDEARVAGVVAVVVVPVEVMGGWRKRTRRRYNNRKYYLHKLWELWSINLHVKHHKATGRGVGTFPPSLLLLSMVVSLVLTNAVHT